MKEIKLTQYSTPTCYPCVRAKATIEEYLRKSDGEFTYNYVNLREKGVDEAHKEHLKQIRSVPVFVIDGPELEPIVLNRVSVNSVLYKIQQLQGFVG